MRILGIEGSSLVTSVAVVMDNVTTIEYTVNLKKTHSQTLLPMIDEVVSMLGTELDSVDAIAVSDGPGSFTELRIGLATTKGLGFVAKKPLVQVPTVDAMVYNLFGLDSLTCPITDARRNQVHTRLYHCKEDLGVVKAQCAMDMGELVRELDERGETVAFLGDGVPVYRPLIGETMKTPYLFVLAHTSRQRAGAAAALGMEYLAEENAVTVEKFKLDYLRKSQAERRAAEKELEVAEREREEAEWERGEGRRKQKPWKRNVKFT